MKSLDFVLILVFMFALAMFLMVSNGCSFIEEAAPTPTPTLQAGYTFTALGDQRFYGTFEYDGYILLKLEFDGSNQVKYYHEISCYGTPNARIDLEAELKDGIFYAKTWAYEYFDAPYRWEDNGKTLVFSPDSFWLVERKFHRTSFATGR